MHYECIVVGAGPAGATAAHRLAKKGHRVLLIEKEILPRYKPCAGGISGRTVSLLPLLPDGIVKEEIKKITYAFHGKGIKSYEYPQSMGITVNRSDFDYFLVKMADAAGAKVVMGKRVIGVEETNSCIRIKTDDDFIYTCDVLVGAHGARGPVSRVVRGTLYGNPTFFALEAEVYTDELPIVERYSKTIFFDFGVIPFGYGWIFPKKDHLSVGVSTMQDYHNLKFYLNTFLKLYGLYSKIRIKVLQGHPVPIGGGKCKVQKGNILLVGDAAHVADPITGEGIYFSILSSTLASDVISQYLTGSISSLKDYSEVFDERINKGLRLAKRLSRLFYRFPRITYNIMSGNRHINLMVYEISAGNMEYHELYNTYISHLFSYPIKCAKLWLRKKTKVV